MIDESYQLLAGDSIGRISVHLINVSTNVFISESIPRARERLRDDVLEEDIAHKLVVVHAYLIPELLQPLEVLRDIGAISCPKLEDRLQFFGVDKTIRCLVYGL